MLNKFNLSYSAYSTFKTSPLQFYFQYLKKPRKSDPCRTGYGVAGNIVHSAAEDWINKIEDNFDKIWEERNGDQLKGFRDKRLSKAAYKVMYETAKKHCYIDDGAKITTELRFEKEIYGINIKGFIDVFIKNEDGSVIIKDWKTNSKNSYDMHRDQRLFYSWVLYRTNGIIPSCEWVYLKDNKIHYDIFTEQELEDFNTEIQQFIANIDKWGMNIEHYNTGNWKNPFNEYYSLCLNEVDRRQNNDFIELNLSIRGHFVFIEGDVHPKIEQGIDHKTKFDLPDKYHMQQAVKKKAKGIIDVRDVGTVHLYNKKFKCFPIGLLDQVRNICDEFAEYYNRKMKISISDKRDPIIFNQTIQDMPSELLTDKTLRLYQSVAVSQFMEKKAGIINIATGGGKTFVACEIIRQAKAKTLWIIDRKELLLQTKEVLEELLGVKVGMIASGEVDIQDITIATVQSLNSKLVELQDYLYTVNFVCVDEYHKSAAESYQKIFAKLPNVQYRLGLTATPNRDDGKTPILYSILGEVIHKVSTQDLIKLGYLVRPDILFYNLRQFGFYDETYQEDYNMNVIQSAERNHIIKDIVEKSTGKKILILTKIIEHGRMIVDMFPGSKHIHGKAKSRQEIMGWFKEPVTEGTKVLVMTNSIGGEGLDIPDLDIIINAAANKGDVKSIQVLGRVLRIFKKKEGAQYIDFLDCGKHTRKHSQARILAFESQGHTVLIK